MVHIQPSITPRPGSRNRPPNCSQSDYVEWLHTHTNTEVIMLLEDSAILRLKRKTIANISWRPLIHWLHNLVAHVNHQILCIHVNVILTVHGRNNFKKKSSIKIQSKIFSLNSNLLSNFVNLLIDASLPESSPNLWSLVAAVSQKTNNPVTLSWNDARSVTTFIRRRRQKQQSLTFWEESSKAVREASNEYADGVQASRCTSLDEWRDV